MTNYIKWTEELTTKAKFLLQVYKDYDRVAKILDINAAALKNRNNKYWKIDCKTIWTEYNDYMLREFLKSGLPKKEIANAFGTTENAVYIRISQLNIGDK